MKRRDIAICIILWLVTCGFYGIYWMIVLNDETNALAGRQGQSGGMVFLLSLITCGIYGLVWLYQMGEAVEQLHEQHGQPRGSAPLLYLFPFDFFNAHFLRSGRGIGGYVPAGGARSHPGTGPALRQRRRP